MKTSDNKSMGNFSNKDYFKSALSHTKANLSKKGYDSLIEAIMQQEEQCSKPYLNLQQLALFLQMKKCPFITITSPVHIFEQGVDSFLLIADFIIRCNEEGHFKISYQHVEDQLIIHQSHSKGSVEMFFVKIYLLNKARYDRFLNRPFRQNNTQYNF